MSSNHALGIDIAKDDFHACLLHDGKHFAVFPNQDKGFRDLLRWAESLGAPRPIIAMEATGTYSLPLADFCIQEDLTTYVLNPLLIKRYGGSRKINPNKTDQLDALLIAEYTDKHHGEQDMRPYVPDAEEVRQLRQLSRQLDSLKTQLQGQKNARDQLPKTSAAHASKERHIAFLEEEIARVKQEADKHIASSQELKKTHKLLLTIPGVGKELARTTLAELGDVGRFKHAKDVSAWAGLAPKQHSSGKSVYQEPRLKRGGNFRMRRMLYMGACSTLQSNAWKGFVAHERGKKKEGKVLLVAIMDKLMRIIFGVIRSGTPFEASKTFANLSSSPSQVQSL